ncbi:universal stress protein [Sinomonas humi]|uniref:Universal stress protein UspA n=1 Tax=Sinomonas humi TaxID=1338436 RepID=A0A0B2AUC7_9MICC|nr:universal stress protein [Sinomonas humi]KHL05553.1 universal stress protein UspA [Sinomonas humi]
MHGIIVVGVDGSDTARRAARAALRLAAAVEAPLHVVSAYGSDRAEIAGSGSDQFLISDADLAAKTAQSIAADLAHDQDGVRIVAAAVRGRPAEALIRYAADSSASLIVVGNRRMQGIGRVLGSVANSVAHNAPCDVLIAKTDE